MMNERHPGNFTVESEGRARILHAAYPLFVEQGYKAVSMQQIADAARIHKATLYHHFRDKEELFARVVLLAYSQIRSEVEEVIERGGSPADQMVQIACQMFDRTESEFGRLMTDLHENISTEQRNALLKEGSFPWDLHEQIIDQAIREGELPELDRDLVVSMFIGLISGQIWIRKMERVSSPLNEQLARTLVDVLFAGLRASPTAPTISFTTPAEAVES